MIGIGTVIGNKIKIENEIRISIQMMTELEIGIGIAYVIDTETKQSTLHFSKLYIPSFPASVVERKICTLDLLLPQ